MMVANFATTPDLDRAADALVDYMNTKAGDSVVITVDTDTDARAIDAIFRRVQAVQARVVILTMPRLPYQGALADPYVPPAVGPAVKNCDVWIDLTFPYMAGCHVHDEATREGGTAKYLLGGDMGSAGLFRLFGAVDLDKYFELLRPFEKALTSLKGHDVRITDRLGSDVTFKLAEPPFGKPRRADKAGTFLVPGSCTMFPELESVKGTLKFAAIFHEYFTTLSEPLTVHVDGKIREIEGGGADRLLLDRALRRAGGGEYGFVIHFTYGMNPGARATGHSFIEDSRVMGNNAVGMGLPWWMPGGGENHPDAVLSKQSIWIDGEQLVRDGLPIAKDLIEAAKGLVPLPH
jgi:2,5-dihydroxypyridine 5,6-dioxygenase